MNYTQRPTPIRVITPLKPISGAGVERTPASVFHKKSIEDFVVVPVPLKDSDDGDLYDKSAKGGPCIVEAQSLDEPSRTSRTKLIFRFVAVASVLIVVGIVVVSVIH